MSIVQRGGQRPRAFYRRDIEAAPLIMASVSRSKTARAGLTDIDTDLNFDNSQSERPAPRPIAVAIAERTLMNQPLPASVEKE